MLITELTTEFKIKKTVFDRKIGYMPVRDEWWSILRGVKEPVLTETAEFSWQKNGDTYVPIAITVSGTRITSGGGKGYDFRNKYDYRFFLEWESINQGIKSHYLDIKQIGLDPGTVLIDKRGDVDVLLGSVGSSRSRILPYTPPQSPWWQQRWFLLTMLVAIIGVLGYGYRRWNHGKSKRHKTGR